MSSRSGNRIHQLVRLTVALFVINGLCVDRRGAKWPSIAGGGTAIVGLGIVAAAPNLPMLLSGAAMFGAGNGAIDVSMNVLGVRVEQHTPKPLMSRFHASFSIGNLLGAGGVFGLSKIAPEQVWLPLVAVIVLGTTGLIALALGSPDVADTRQPATDGVTAGRPRIPAIAWVLGVMAIAFGLTEGTAVDWASIHVTDVTGVSPGTGAIGLVAVACTMTIIRLVGDHLVHRFGRTMVVQAGTVLALSGYAVTVFASPLTAVLTGWLLVGLGVGMIAPQIYALAGHLGGGRVMAVVTGFGYAAFLAGPAIIGFTSRHIGIQRAMFVPLGSAVVLIVLATVGVLRRAEAAARGAATV